MKLSKQPPEEGVELMMTPMIDIVFQLLIFFMVVATISDIVGNVKVVLPLSPNAGEDVNQPPGRLIINIQQDGKYVVGGQERSITDLKRLVAREAKLTQDPTTPGVANRSVLLRVDRYARYSRVETVMALCKQRGLWKLSFAGRSEPDESTS